jgi:hypothetical protein
MLVLVVVAEAVEVLPEDCFTIVAIVPIVSIVLDVGVAGVEIWFGHGCWFWLLLLKPLRFYPKIVLPLWP